MGTRLLILLSQFPPSPTLGAQESCRVGSFHSKSDSVTSVCPGDLRRKPGTLPESLSQELLEKEND